MATPQEVVDQLKDYAYDRSSQACYFIQTLSYRQLTEIVGDATTFEQGWRRVRAFDRTGTATPAKPPKVKKMTTKEFRERLALEPPYDGKLKCWELVIEAFGVTGQRTGRGEHVPVILGKLMKDKEWSAEKVTELAPKGVTPTLAVFLAQHLTGDWIIFTRNHALAIRDGVIHDTVRSSSVSKVVTGAYRIRSTKLTKPAGCDCADAAVFGHWNNCRQR